MPDRVVVDKEGSAYPPRKALEEYKTKAHAIFIRDDQWTLGAPRALQELAQEMYAEQWLGIIRRDQTKKADGSGWDTFWVCSMKSAHGYWMELGKFDDKTGIRLDQKPALLEDLPEGEKADEGQGNELKGRDLEDIRKWLRKGIGEAK